MDAKCWDVSPRQRVCGLFTQKSHKRLFFHLASCIMNSRNGLLEC